MGSISTNLGMLYDYMTRTLLQANLHNELEKYEEVERLLRDLRDAWQAIRPQVVKSPLYA